MIEKLETLLALRDRGRKAGALEKIAIAEQIVELVIPLLVDIVSELEEMKPFPKPAAPAEHLAALERRLRVLEGNP